MTDLYIVNDIRNFAFGLAKAFAYGFGKDRKQKFIMSFTISIVGTSRIPGASLTLSLPKGGWIKKSL